MVSPHQIYIHTIWTWQCLTECTTENIKLQLVNILHDWPQTPQVAKICPCDNEMVQQLCLIYVLAHCCPLKADGPSGRLCRSCKNRCWWFAIFPPSNATPSERPHNSGNLVYRLEPHCLKHTLMHQQEVSQNSVVKVNIIEVDLKISVL